MVTDYVDLARQLKNLAKKKGATDQEITRTFFLLIDRQILLYDIVMVFLILYMHEIYYVLLELFHLC